MTSAAVFAKINNAILDLQNSQHQTYELPLRTLARALSDPSLALINSRLTAEVDLNSSLQPADRHAVVKRCTGRWMMNKGWG